MPPTGVAPGENGGFDKQTEIGLGQVRFGRLYIVILNVVMLPVHPLALGFILMIAVPAMGVNDGIAVTSV